MKLHKLEGLVDCQFCKLIFDYCKVCKHFNQQKDDIVQQEQMKKLVSLSQHDKKIQALSKITASLDVLSTCRVTSFTLTKN